jgi:Protein of unknown function (DUF2844)
MLNLSISSVPQHKMESGLKDEFGPKEGSSVKSPQIFLWHRNGAKSFFWAAILSGTLLMIDSPALAGLGEDASSVQADQAQMLGSLRSTQIQSYAVHEIHGATGTTVREYVSGGKVFAVSWQGPWPPDMRQILASYFDQYQQAAQTQVSSRAGRGPLRIEQPGLVVQSGGHMRSFAGRAYIPEMLPPEVSGEAIQ